MKFFFLRHTSLDVKKDIFYGQTDLDVSNSFNNELKLIKKKIKTERISFSNFVVYSSPLKRCLKLAKSLHNEIHIDDRLKEMNLGDWEMKEFSSIEKNEIEKWENDLLNYKIPNGETNMDFLKRLKSFTDEIINLKKDVFIVAHAGSINGMISNLTGEPFDKLVKNYWEKISYGSLSLILNENDKNTIKFLGK